MPPFEQNTWQEMRDMGAINDPSWKILMTGERLRKPRSNGKVANLVSGAEQTSGIDI